VIADRHVAISRVALVHALVVYLPPAAAATGLAMLAYLLVQQCLRLSADDLPAALAESTVSQLDRGVAPDQALPPDRIELTHSLSPFVLVFDASGQLVTSSAILEGQAPRYPLGALESARARGENRVTWQPEAGVRLATVARPWSGGFVVAGQSLQLTEQHIDTVGARCLAGWLATEALIAVAVAVSMGLEVALLR
jgi:hypothetical protein